MSCKAIKSITYNLCDTNMGGITKIYLANIDDVSAVTFGTATTLSDSGITGITMVSGKTFEEFAIKKNTSNFTSTLTVNDNGSSYVSTVLSFLLPKMDAAKKAAMNAFMLAEAVAIVKDANGRYWFLGEKWVDDEGIERESPLTNTAGTGETGTAKSDANQYTIELTAETGGYPEEVLGSIVASLLA